MYTYIHTIIMFVIIIIASIVDMFMIMIMIMNIIISSSAFGTLAPRASYFAGFFRKSTNCGQAGIACTRESLIPYYN